MTPPAHNGEAITLRRAESTQDFTRAHALFEEYAASLGFDLRFQNFDEELLHLPEMYAPPSGCLLLAFVGDNAAGCVAVRPFQDGICEMKRLYVKPEFRDRGLGTMLTERIIGEARELGYGTMRLDTVASMERARALYTSLGFRPIAPYRHNPLPGASFMELALSPTAQRISWQWRSYQHLSTDDLYDLLALRQMVFVVEQKCAYLDADGFDRSARHLLGRADDGALAGSLRLLPPGCRFEQPSIGRVVAHPQHRGRGMGRLMMKQGIAEASRLYPGESLKVSAQQHLRSFYETLGFVADGDPYEEDGIPHLGMIRPWK